MFFFFFGLLLLEAFQAMMAKTTLTLESLSVKRGLGLKGGDEG